VQADALVYALVISEMSYYGGIVERRIMSVRIFTFAFAAHLLRKEVTSGALHDHVMSSMNGDRCCHISVLPIVKTERLILFFFCFYCVHFLK